MVVEKMPFSIRKRWWVTQENISVFGVEVSKLSEIELDAASGEFKGKLYNDISKPALIEGKLDFLGVLTASATSSTLRGGFTPVENEEPRFASQASKAMGKTSPFLYFDKFTLSFLLLSFVPSSLISNPRWAKVGGSHPKAWYSATCLGVEISHSSPRMTCVIFIRWSSTTFAKW